MERAELVGALEAVIFAAGSPVTSKELRQIFERVWAGEPAEVREANLAELRGALDDLKERWLVQDGVRGFHLVEVAEGLTFRSDPVFADVLRAMRQQRPARLSRAALEVLSIVAYRQPVTKPEIDDIRGVDSGGTIRLLLDKDLVRILGKKDEVGRPLLYGTTKEFLGFFNLKKLTDLPTLREYHELTQESEEKLAEIEAPTVEDLRDSVKQLRLKDETAVDALDEAMTGLSHTTRSTKQALAEEGIALDPGAEEEPKPAPNKAKGDEPPSQGEG